MEGVTVVTHPLVQHKLTLLRDKNRSTKSFRELCKEIGVPLCYEVTRDLPLTDVEIETPLIRMSTPRIAGKKLVFAPILRAGMTFVEGMLDLVPAARVKERGAKDIRFVCLIAAQQGVERVRGLHPDVRLWTAAILFILLSHRRPSSFPSFLGPPFE
jgi:uracil phosphoribosyltransferase